MSKNKELRKKLREEGRTPNSVRRRQGTNKDLRRKKGGPTNRQMRHPEG